MNETGKSLDRGCPTCATMLPAGSTFCTHCGAAAVQTASDDPLLDSLRALFGRELQIEREIGRGGTASVFAAYDPALERRVAVKALLPNVAADPDMSLRFQREARTVAALQHPNVVTVYGVRTNGDLSAIMMQFVEGRSLDAALRDSSAMPLPVAGLILAQVAAGLQHAHDRGIVHRDMKPANVLLANDGLAVVSDFGIARREGIARITASGIMMGTVSYMSPEQIVGGTVGPPSDQYSFGVMAFELLAGRRLFKGTHAQILSAHRNDVPPALTELRPDLPTLVASYVARLLEKRADERHPNLRDAQRVFLTLVPDKAAAATQIVSISQARAAARSGGRQAAPTGAESSRTPDAIPMGAAPPSLNESRRRLTRPLVVAAMLVVGASLAATAWMFRSRPSMPARSPVSLAGTPAAARPATTEKPNADVPAARAAQPIRGRESSPPISTSLPIGSAPTASSAPTSRDTAAATSTIVTSNETRPPPSVSAEPPPTANSASPPSPSMSAATTAAASATLADARAIAREFVTLCNQRRWREIEVLGSLAGDAALRAEIVRLVRNAPDLAAGFERVASAPKSSPEGFVTEFVIDLEWRRGRRLASVHVQAIQEKGAWHLASFGVSTAE